MRIRARALRGVTEVKVLMPHPMETGLRRSATGEPVAVHHITHVVVTLGVRTVFEARCSFSMSRDPLIVFRIRDAQAGQRLRVVWTDNRGQERSDEAVIT